MCCREPPAPKTTSLLLHAFYRSPWLGGPRAMARVLTMAGGYGKETYVAEGLKETFTLG